MNDKRLRTIVVVGGGTAGWMTAAALIKKFGDNKFTKIKLIESPDIPTVGVGEATVPSIREFLRGLDISEIDFVKRTNATFKLAIRFDDWAGKDTSFYHPFADHGVPISGVPFIHYWTKMRLLGKKVEDIDAYNLGSQLAENDRFAVPQVNKGSGNGLFNFAFHFDAKLAAAYFRSWAELGGVDRLEASVSGVSVNTNSGFIERLSLDNGDSVEGNFFIDCTGFQGLLIKQALGVEYEDWSQWLPCDRAVAIQSELGPDLPSYTRAKAHAAGWQWRIPLQTRVGNGYVYSREYSTDDDALACLESELTGDRIGEPKLLRFTTGLRKKFWEKNVYSIGLAAGFLEPLESTGIYFIQSGIQALLNNFPNADFNQALINEVNRTQRLHWERARDFLILHYALNKRHDEPFWDRCRTMALPLELVDNIELYKRTGRLRLEASDFFQKSSWVSMFSGFGIVPERYHPSVDDIPSEDIEVELRNMSAGMREAAERTLRHKEFIEKNCSSKV